MALLKEKHQYLLVVARALLFQASFPLHFWGDAVLLATYIINWIPTPVLNHKTLFETLFHKPPSYSSFKVFGSLCFTSTLSHNRKKFAPRAQKCIFVGYPTGIKGFKLYDVESHMPFVSRDDVFYEHIFAFAKSHSSVSHSFLHANFLSHQLFPDFPFFSSDSTSHPSPVANSDPAPGSILPSSAFLIPSNFPFTKTCS